MATSSASAFTAGSAGSAGSAADPAQSSEPASLPVNDPGEVVLQLNLTPQAAAAVQMACEVLARLGLGQLEEIANLVRTGHVPMRPDEGTQARKIADAGRCEAMDRLVDEAKHTLGFARGASLGIFHPHTSQDTRHAWEAHKVLSQALARLRDPNPPLERRGVHYDGLWKRLCEGPAPSVRVECLDRASDAPDEAAAPAPAAPSPGSTRLP